MKSHVVCKRVSVSQSQVIILDVRSDVAVVKVEARDLPRLPLRDSLHVQGDSRAAASTNSCIQHDYSHTNSTLTVAAYINDGFSGRAAHMFNCD
jgi:hypothetical protein